MIGLERFLGAVRTILGHELSSNADQYDIVTMPAEVSIKVVAGPGSGKTTVIVLRILKAVYVDDIDPSRIVATTFTVKASKELKSRILSWGESIRLHCLRSPDLPQDTKERIKKINFDSTVTGTLDSIAENVRSDNRSADENPVVLIDDYLALRFMNLAIVRNGSDTLQRLKEEYKYNSLGGEGSQGWGSDAIPKSLLEVYSRAKENSIPIGMLAPKLPEYVKVLETYESILHDKQFMDFPELEQEFLRFLDNDRAHLFTDRLSLLMIDEYQDTNPLQEKIYFKLAGFVRENGGSVMVVGDDDQSIYRFRGSRAILFSNLEERIAPVGIDMVTRFLSVNYRSTPEIVDFCNDFVNMDRAYQAVRIKDKPPMSVGRHGCDRIPILMVFRDTKEEIADFIVRLVTDYVENGRIAIKGPDGNRCVIERSPEGCLGDIALLCKSPRNYSSGNEPRLPLLLRQRLEENGGKIKIFNPRGTPLNSVPNVSILCGLLLNCLDPAGNVEGLVWRSKDAQTVLRRWRDAAEDFVAEGHVANGVRLSDYVEAWQKGKPLNGTWDKDSVPILDIIYNLIAWMPSFHNDAEGLVYLQAITNAITQSVHVNGQDASISFEGTVPKEASVKALIKDVLVPIADGVIQIEEDLLFSVNTLDRLNIMSIHQSKGLEFPIVIVDVGSDFKSNHWKQAKDRFPQKLDSTSVIDGLLKEYMDEDYGERDYKNQMFDALTRLQFVAYSRAQDVLILVGLTPNIQGKVQNVALGWTRDGDWKWERKLTGR